MKSEILSLLRERGDYVSGQELCERFGVSRTAVWKSIEQLKKDGYEIAAVRNRGYLLQESAAFDVFGQNELESRIRTKWVGKRALFFPEIGSTNIRAKQEAEEGAPEGTLIVSDHQTAGRGRRGRAWDSPAGCNIYFTLMLRPKISPEEAPMMTLLMALAVAGAMESLHRESGLQTASPQIKWPNDIVLDGKKVCGILTEMSVEQAYIQYVVIGVGINVRKQAFPEEIAATATSMEEAWNLPVARCELIGRICSEFEGLYETFLEAHSLAPMRETYESFLANKGRKVRVLDPAGEYEGTALGINDRGELLVETAEGSIKEVYAGEVSVRGIYGYI